MINVSRQYSSLVDTVKSMTKAISRDSLTAYISPSMKI